MSAEGFPARREAASIPSLQEGSEEPGGTGWWGRSVGLMERARSLGWRVWVSLPPALPHWPWPFMSLHPMSLECMPGGREQQRRTAPHPSFLASFIIPTSPAVVGLLEARPELGYLGPAARLCWTKLGLPVPCTLWGIRAEARMWVQFMHASLHLPGPGIMAGSTPPPLPQLHGLPLGPAEFSWHKWGN